ncbi:hypothetical protein SAMN05421693_12510 [Ectothiorhodospira magna]|uniref:Uncharacterized protein n=1 Tax=Ectothiorhodospira magna TaxID=867345 RepID=A0A1H9FA44_9GAMM|nr:hypothetical protein [Ectothiorhodospira magna]SEQ34178.1 hypothetical protein SAMN05421693_12510 [Ectothiorhodospira magna]
MKTKEKTDRRVFFWLVFLFSVNLIYLLYELSFNSRLVDVAVTSITDAQVRALELEGRILSGIGLSLLLLRFIKINHISALRFLKISIMLIAIGFSSMYFGQRILVDFLVDRTTAEQRMDAQLLVFMKQGLATNSLQLEGIEFDDSDLDSAHTRSFISIVGLMTFFSPDFIVDLRDNAESILNQVAINESIKATPSSYEDYLKLRDSIVYLWNEYEKISDEYWAAKSYFYQEAGERWNILQSNLLNQWEQLSENLDEHEFTRKVLALQRNLDTYFKARESCEDSRFRNECIIKVEDIYRAEIVKSIGRYVAPRDWCHEPETVTKTVQRGSRFVTERREVQQCHDLSYDHLSSKLSFFVRAPISYDLFIRDPVLSSQIRSDLLAEGVVLKDSWIADDRDGFMTAAVEARANLARERLENEMLQRLGVILPLDMSAEEFLRSDFVQARLHKALQPMDPLMILRLDYTPLEFHQMVLKPRFIHMAENEYQKLHQDIQEMANGGWREEEGKSYVRALIVPPIAMGFSLFFALVNSIGLIASIPALFGWKRPILVWSMKLGGIIGVIAIPMINSSSVVETETYKYFESQVSDTLGPVAGFFATWVVNTEPSVYAVGRFAQHVAPPLISSGDHKKENIYDDSDVSLADDLLINEQRLENDHYPFNLKSSIDAGESIDDVFDSVGLNVNDHMRDMVHALHLSGLTPLMPQVMTAVNNKNDAIMIDVQQLRDGAWVVHRSPLITGTGTCLTNHQRIVDIGLLDSVQWRAARHGSCGSDMIAINPVSIPFLTDFSRQVSARFPDISIWVHFQPTLHGEVFCHHLRRGAAELSAMLGQEKFSAVVSSSETLACFLDMPRDYAVIYMGPEYGDPGIVAQSTPHHISRQEIISLRGRARGDGYRPYAFSISPQTLDMPFSSLKENDAIVIHHRHESHVMHEFLRDFPGRTGVFFSPGSRSEDVLIENYKILISRNGVL